MLWGKASCAFLANVLVKGARRCSMSSGTEGHADLLVLSRSSTLPPRTRGRGGRWRHQGCLLHCPPGSLGPRSTCHGGPAPFPAPSLSAKPLSSPALGLPSSKCLAWHLCFR